jgi:preprotein translocase subunit SecF
MLKHILEKSKDVIVGSHFSKMISDHVTSAMLLAAVIVFMTVLFSWLHY